MITASTTLRELAFIVGDALEKAGEVAVLSGGGAAAVYAPEAIQSHDLDFILGYFTAQGGVPEAPLIKLEFSRKGQKYTHPLTPYWLEFPKGPLMVAGEEVDPTILEENGRRLHILTPTDCVRDRLSGYLHFNDFSALEQALMVARKHEINLDTVGTWCEDEGVGPKGRTTMRLKFENFKARLESGE